MNIRFKALVVIGAWTALFYAAGQEPTVSSEQVQSALAKLEPNIRENLERTKVPESLWLSCITIGSCF